MSRRLWNAILLMAATACVVGAADAPRSSSVAPAWFPGDTWQVKYVVPTEGSDEVRGTMDVVFTYEVMPELESPKFPGVPVVILRLTSDKLRRTEFLTFRAYDKSLLLVEQLASDHRYVRSRNEFGDESVMFTALAGTFGVVFDFPRFPLTPGRREISDEETMKLTVRADPPRPLPPLGEDNPTGFVESIRRLPSTSECEVTFSRTDLRQHELMQTTLVFDGGKWWRSAQIKLGEKVIASGTRL
jgi:hypothetical protein